MRQYLEQTWQFYEVLELKGKDVTDKWGNCYCGVEGSVTEPLSGKDRLIGGNVVGAPALAPPPADCYHVGKDHPGHNLPSHNDEYILTAQFCQIKCQQTPKCKGFSWSPGHCWLKSSVAPKMTEDSNVISGPRECKN